MENLTTFILATAGLSWILCRSSLFKKLRESLTFLYDETQAKKRFNARVNIIKEKLLWYLDSLFSCVGCMGFWAGVINYIILGNKLSLEIIVYSFIGSISSLLIVSLLGFLDRK